MKIKKKLSGRALVIQICNQELRVASAKLGSAPRLKTRVVRPLPEGAVEDGAILNPDALQDALKSALRERGIRNIRNAVFTLCTSQVLSETVAVRTVKSRRLSAAAEDRLMEKTLDTNRDIYFPVDTHGSSLVWTPVGVINDDDGSIERSVQLWAVPNAMLEEYYKLANACGLKVLAVDYCGNSFTGFVRAGYAAPAPSGKKKGKKAKPSKSRKTPVTGDGTAPAEERPRGTVLYLLPEEDFLLMTFVRGRQVTHQRLLNRSSSYMDELEDARMVLELYETEHSGSGDIRVSVCGAKALDPEYVARVEEALNLPASAQTVAPADEWCLCAGAAGTQLDFGNPALNFPGRPHLLQKVWQYAFLLIGGGLLAATAFQYLGDSLEWDIALGMKESTLSSLQASLANVSGYEQNWRDYETYYNKYETDWRLLLGSDEDGNPGILRSYNDNLSLMIGELEQVIPDGVTVTEIGIAPEGLSLQIACKDKLTAAYIIQALRNLQYGEEPSYISNLTIGPEGAVSAFSVLASLAQATGSPEAPPTEGSASDLSDVFDGSGLSSGDQNTLIEISDKLARGETISDREAESVKEILEDVQSDRRRIAIARALCEGTNADNTEITYTLDQVIRVSSVEDRKNGFKRMLDNPFAVYLFAELIRTDVESNNSALRGYLEDFCWKYFAEDWFRAIFAPSDLQAIVKGDYSPLMDVSLTDMQTLLVRFIDDRYQTDDKYYLACEDLLKDDETLSGVLAYYICIEKRLPLGGDEAYEIDPDTGLEIDPLTGLLIDPDTGLLFDMFYGLYVDRTTNEYIDPDTGILFDLSSGLYIDKKTKKLYDPQTGEDLDPATDMRMAKYTWPMRTQLEGQNYDISALDWSKIDWTVITWRIMTEDDVVDALCQQAEKLLKANVTIDPNTGLAVDSRTGLLYEPNTGLYIDPNTGHLVDADGSAINPLTDSRLSQFMKYLPLVAQYTGLDPDTIDWTKIDWRRFNWSNLASMDNVNELINQAKDIQSGSTGSGFYVDPFTGQLKYEDTGELVNPATDPKLRELVGLLEQYLRMDLDNFNWGAIDWRDINIDNPGRTDLLNLIRQINANLSGQALTDPSVPSMGDQPGSAEPPDTRIYFTVAIPYKESLIEAEMERKSLSRNEIREKLKLEDYQ